ncbi:insulinase family protein [Vibrio genomosp. F6]|uniref:insulinase family protein n=1 Tax=Vibrio genomosp. F6 TaxID=723172 RepID=UPI0014830BC4|nr:insulinase family protein [Vibrio genomosp. F6]
MKLHILTFIFCALLVGCSTSSTMTPIKEDPYWVSDSLENGLRYHIYPDKGKPVSVRLIIHAGSFQETPQQTGFAHFTEHMAFNGSAHFSKNDVIHLFEQAGASFGPDINAYTNYQDTVYKLDLPDNSRLNDALVWFRDIGDGINFNSEEIQKEKGVLLGEFRYSRLADKSIASTFYDYLILGSRYQQHDPIGNPASISDTQVQDLHAFYKTWYQPQIAEVIITGDVTLDQATTLVKKHFATWEKGTTPPPVKVNQFSYNDTDFIDYVASTESPSISIVINRGSRVIHTREDQMKQWLDEMSQQIIQQRMTNVFIDSALPAQWLFSTSYLLEYQNYSITNVSFPSQYRDKVQPLFFSTLASIRDYGVTDAELNTALKTYQDKLEYIKPNWENMDAVEHANGKTNAIVIDQVVQSQLDMKSTLKQFLSSVDLKLINHHIEELLSSDYQLAIGLDKSEDKPSIKATFPAIKSAYQKTGTKPLVKNVDAAFVLPEKKGVIISQEINHHGLTHFILSNGVNVWYQRDLDAGDDVNLSIASLGGKSSLKPELFAATELMIPVASRSGLGQFSGAQLNSHLTEKNIEIVPYVTQTRQGVDITTKKENLAESLAALYNLISDLKLDQKQLEAVKQEFTQNRNAYLNSPAGKFAQSINGNSYLPTSSHIMLTSESITAVNQEQLQEAHKQLFKQNRNYQMVITASLRPSEIKPLLRQYVASIDLEKASKVDFNVAYQPQYQPRIEMDINNEKGSQYLLRVISTEPEVRSTKTIFMDDMLQRIITMRLTAYVREELSLDYAPFVMTLMEDSEPNSDWLIGAQVAPHNEAMIEKAIDKVVSDIQLGVSNQEVEIAAKQLMKDMTSELNNQKLYTWSMTRYLVHNYGFDEFLDLEGTAKGISKEDLSNRAKMAFGSSTWQSKNILRPKS